MHTVLVYLRSSSKGIYDKPGWHSEHLGIAYLAAAIRSVGFTADVIDAATEGLDLHQVLDRILRAKPQLVGFSVTYATIRPAIQLSEALKNEIKPIHVCFGGHHATFSARDILEHEPSVDSVVRGDGEDTVLELVRALEKGRSLDGIAGVWYRCSDGSVRTNVERALREDLDDLPFPSREALRVSLKEHEVSSASICSSRGCPWSCAFCSTPSFYRIQGGTTWRARSAQNVLDEMQYLADELGCRYFTFVDDNIVLPSLSTKTRLREIAQGILRRGLKVYWHALCSTLAVGPTDKELLQLLRESGLVWVFLGVEAGSATTLNQLEKYNGLATRERSIETMDLLLDAGLLVLAGGILFEPYATFAEIIENGEFLRVISANPRLGLFGPYCTQLQVYPGIPIYDRLLADGLLIGDRHYLTSQPYKFVHKDVASLAGAMSDVLADATAVDWARWDTVTTTEVISRKYEHDSGVVTELNRIQREVEAITKSLAEANYRFFSSAVEAVGRDDMATIGTAKTCLQKELAEIAQSLAPIRSQAINAVTSDTH